jgi:hypothetical protein
MLNLAKLNSQCLLFKNIAGQSIMSINIFKEEMAFSQFWPSTF